MSVYIVTDSTSDIPQDLLEELPIIVVPLYVILNGKSYLDKVDLTRKTFYETLPSSEPHASTATPAPDQFIQAYDQAADQGAEAVFSIHISKSLSATYQSAETAAKQYQRIPVYPVDSGNLTLAEGLIVIKAAEAAKEGKSVEEIQSIINSIIPRTHAYAKLDTIDYLKKGGRMSSIQHSVVSILGIKPILKMNDHSSSMEIARTKSKAFEKVLKTAVDNLPYAEAFGITHANVPDQVEELIGRMKEMIPSLQDPLVSEVTPALGVHVGPGSLCVNWIECEAHCAETEKKGLMSLLWVISLTLKNSSIVDIFWGTGFIITSWIAFVRTIETVGARDWLIVILVTIWGLRLSLYVLRRNAGKGEDFRYVKWRNEAGSSWWWKSYFKVFLLQGLIMWVVAAPLTAIQLPGVNDSLGILDYLGIAIWALGFYFEVVGDAQLAIFKANRDKKEKLLTTGVWRYTRHPNYFGDSAQWWGFYIIALSSGAWWTIISPILMTYLLVKVSGVAMLERTLKNTKPEYEDYAQKTNAFIPWFPKK